MTRLLFSFWSSRYQLVNLFRYCSKNSLLDQRVHVHAASLKTIFDFDLMLSNDLIDMYTKCGVMDNAFVFNRMFDKNVVSWTTLMCGHLQIGNVRETLSLFFQMVFSCFKPNEYTFFHKFQSLQIVFSCFKPNEYTFSKIFRAYGILNVLEIGMQIHC
ncbi:hypothetical protein GQ457_16G026540 [Hibiscus cannabinus]